MAFLVSRFATKPWCFRHPGAVEIAERWRARNKCATTASENADDLMPKLTGPETTTRLSGCKDNMNVALWTITDGPHIPIFNANVAGKMFDFLLQHRVK